MEWSVKEIQYIQYTVNDCKLKQSKNQSGIKHVVEVISDHRTNLRLARADSPNCYDSKNNKRNGTFNNLGNIYGDKEMITHKNPKQTVVRMKLLSAVVSLGPWEVRT